MFGIQVDRKLTWKQQIKHMTITVNIATAVLPKNEGMF